MPNTSISIAAAKLKIARIANKGAERIIMKMKHGTDIMMDRREPADMPHMVIRVALASLRFGRRLASLPR
jgi:hypothetical protein